MGTKNNPGNYDCYEKAEPDEPMFVLLARDETAADFVEMWADIHGGNPIGATEVFAKLMRKLQLTEINQPKIIEAYNCSMDMRNYKK